MGDINHPTDPEELLETLWYYRLPIHLKNYQQFLYDRYVEEFGKPPPEYEEVFDNLINREI